MSTTHTTRASIALKPFWRRQQFWRRALPTIAAIAVIVAGILVYNAFVGTSGISDSRTGWGVTYRTPAKQKTVKLELGAVQAMRQFVNTAVARKNLKAAYAISGPQVREGMSLAEWSRGTIAVVPYRITPATSAHMKIDHSYRNEAQFEVYLKTPGLKGHDFFVDVIKRDGKWLVNGWVPRGTPPIPVNPGG